MSEHSEQPPATGLSASGQSATGTPATEAVEPPAASPAAGPADGPRPAPAAEAVAAARQAAAEAPTVDQVKLALRKVKDPELSLNIVDLGLVYDIRVEGPVVDIDMSLTSPGCPSGPEIMTEAEQAVRAIPEVEDVKVNLVWSPYWTPERIEPRVRAYMGF